MGGGREGSARDRQADRQTDRQTDRPPDGRHHRVTSRVLLASSKAGLKITARLKIQSDGPFISSRGGDQCLQQSFAEHLEKWVTFDSRVITLKNIPSAVAHDLNILISLQATQKVLSVLS